MDLYKQTNFGERSGKCYVLKKGDWRVNPEDVQDGIVIDNLSEKEKVKVFNECEYCISYDTQTAYSGIAAICGCVSIIVPEQGKTREDYLSNGEVGYGCAYGFDDYEIEFARKTRSKVKEYYSKRNVQSKESVNQFIMECGKYFN